MSRSTLKLCLATLALGCASTAALAGEQNILRLVVPGIRPESQSQSQPTTPPPQNQVYNIITSGAGRTLQDGTLASSCLAYLNGDSTHQYAGATGSGVYTLNVSGNPTNLYCDMTSDGGGWTLVQKASDSELPSSWFTQSAVKPTALTTTAYTATGKLADADINARVTVGYRFTTLFKNVTRIRYTKPTCVFNQSVTPTGDCGATYASLSWTEGLFLTSANKASMRGIADAQSGTGLYIETGDVRGYYWFTGNGPEGKGALSSDYTYAGSGSSFLMFVK